MAQKETTWFDLNEALKHPELVYRLDLSHQNLKAVPLALCKLTRLKRLDLSHNQLTGIPSVVFDSLRDLRRLHLDHNRISELPETIYSLGKLKKLYLNHNQLRSVSPKIGQLTELSRLTLNGNKLTTIPVEIMQFSDLEWLDLDDEVFLSAQFDSLKMRNVGNWKCIAQVPDSIAGVPLSYYLNHPAIDRLSKLYVQDRYPLRLHVENCPFEDSLFTENEETAPFYTFLYFDLMKDNLTAYSYLEQHLCSLKGRFLVEQPCRYLKGLMEYENGYSCLDFMPGIDAQQHVDLIEDISSTCPDLLNDRANLYFQYLNQALPPTEMKGLLTARINKSELDSQRVEESYYYSQYVMVLSDGEDKLIRATEWVFVEEDELFYQILPGAYTLRVFDKENYLKRKDEVLKELQGNSLNSPEDGNWYQKIKNECLTRVDTVVQSIDEHIALHISLDRLKETQKDSIGNSLISPTLNREIYAVPILEYEHHNRTSNGDCEFLLSAGDSLALELFLREVYIPAKSNTSLLSQNRNFLEQVKSYLVRRATTARDSIYQLPFPLSSVYGLKKQEEGQTVRLLDTQAYANWQEEETYGTNQRYNNYPPQDSTFYEGFIGKKWNVYYEDGKVRPYTLNQYELIRDACIHHHSYKLYDEGAASIGPPVFASQSNLVLEYVKDTLVDNQMECLEVRRHSYCDSSIPHHSFARLKGVPKLIFTTETQDDWMNRYPGRGLYMKLNDGTVIELWYEEFEYVECSCI